MAAKDFYCLFSILIAYFFILPADLLNYLINCLLNCILELLTYFAIYSYLTT